MRFQDRDWLELLDFVKSLGGQGELVAAPGVREGCEEYLDLLLRKNEVVNLTAIRDSETALWKHFADSLALLSLEPLGCVLDWGSGGGFPGIPLAIVRKQNGLADEVRFVDSVGKKVRAIQEFCEQLHLGGTSFLHARGEALLQSGKLSGVSTVVMRAVAPAERAVQWVDRSVPHWVFLLGPQQMEEWKKQERKLASKGMMFAQEKSFALPRGSGDRVLLKVSRCST